MPKRHRPRPPGTRATLSAPPRTTISERAAGWRRCDGRTAERDPRRDAHRVGRPDRDGRRPRAARRRLPADRRRPPPGDPDLRTLREGPRVPGRLPERVAAHGRGASRRRRTAPRTSTRAGRSSIPEKWVPDGYACVRVDSRGAGRSPGYIDHLSPRETKDFYDCIEWAGVQAWWNGKVGLNGISYYAINQWHVASLQPQHLAAMCVWEGAADFYRDMTHHGGILSTFWANWYDMQVKTVQYGLGERGPRSRVTGELVCGDETLSEKQLIRQPLRLRRRDPRPPARRRLSQGPLAGLGEGHRAAPHRGELGRAGPASARQLRGLRPRRVEGEMARGARHRALDPILHRLRRGCCRSASSTISSRARTTAGTSSRACSSRSAATSNSSSGTRASGRSRARNGRSSISTRRAGARAASRRRRRRASRSTRSATA